VFAGEKNQHGAFVFLSVVRSGDEDFIFAVLVEILDGDVQLVLAGRLTRAERQVAVEIVRTVHPVGAIEHPEEGHILGIVFEIGDKFLFPIAFEIGEEDPLAVEPAFPGEILAYTGASSGGAGR